MEAEAAYQTGLILFGERRYDEALNAFSEAIRLDPVHARAYFDRGATLFNLGDYSGTVNDFEHALRLDPNNVAIRNWLGVARQMLASQPADD